MLAIGGIGFRLFFPGDRGGAVPPGEEPEVSSSVFVPEVELLRPVTPADDSIHTTEAEAPARTPAALHPGLPTRFEDFELRDGEELPFVPHETLEAMFEGELVARNNRGGVRLPLDPVLGGSASIHLELEDRDGNPLASRAALWRIDAPGSLTWTAGSQRQRMLDIPLEGLLVEGLAAGTYRLQVDGCAMNEPDPTSFEVFEGPRQRVVLRTLTPVERPFHLRLFRMDGTIVESAHLARRYYGSRRVEHPIPNWATGREPRVYTDLFSGGGSGGSFTTGGLGKPKEILAGLSGLPLGDFEQSTRRSRSRWKVHLTLPSEGLRAPSLNVLDVDGSTELAAIAVDVSRFMDRVRLSDGRTGHSAGVSVTASPRVIDAERLNDEAAWSACTVEVSARAKGFVTQSATWSPRDASLPDLFLDFEPAEEEVLEVEDSK